MIVPPFSKFLPLLKGEHYWKDLLNEALELAPFPAKLEETATELLRQRYNTAVATLSGLQDQPCWREIALPFNVVATELEHIGVYWTSSEEAAESYSGKYTETSRPVRFQAKVDLQYVDVTGTLEANLKYPYEKEVRYKPNAPIFVVELEDDGEVVEVREWRLT